jgi:DNA primase
MEGVDFKGALKILAEKAGVELVREDPKKRTEREQQYALIEDAAKFFFREGTNNKAAQEYVLGRGVDGKSIHLWRVGFAPDEWRALRTHLAEQGYTDTQMLRAGLIKRADNGKEPYDVFRNRIMFPMCDSSGRVVAFSGRALSGDEKTPKYVNSPETELYKKSEILFGYDKARDGIRKLDFSLLVEGQFDLVLAHQAGYGNTVAVSGTAFTDQHVNLIRRLSNRTVLALDADRAGLAAMKRAAAMLLRAGMDVKAIRIEGGKDPADIIQEDAARFRHMIGGAMHVVELLLSVLKDGAKDERAYKLLVREELLPLVASMPNRIDREHFEGVVAEALGSTKDGVHFEVERIATAHEHEYVRQRAAAKEEVAAGGDTRRADAKAARERYFFAAARFLETFGSQAHIAENVRALLKEILGERYEEVCEVMTDEVLNHELTYLERTYAEFPDRTFFDDLAGKLARHYQNVLDALVSGKRAALTELERGGEGDDVHAALIREIDTLRTRKAGLQITTEMLLEDHKEIGA